MLHGSFPTIFAKFSSNNFLFVPQFFVTPKSLLRCSVGSILCRSGVLRAQLWPKILTFSPRKIVVPGYFLHTPSRFAANIDEGIKFVCCVYKWRRRKRVKRKISRGGVQLWMRGWWFLVVEGICDGRIRDDAEKTLNFHTPSRVGVAKSHLIKIIF